MRRFLLSRCRPSEFGRPSQAGVRPGLFWLRGAPLIGFTLCLSLLAGIMAALRGRPAAIGPPKAARPLRSHLPTVRRGSANSGQANARRAFAPGRFTRPDIQIGPLGPLAWVDVALLVWFALTAVSVAYVAWDAWRNNPELTVMKWGWVLVTLYLGGSRLMLYVPLVQGALSPGPTSNSSSRSGAGPRLGIHCVAGDATGIIVAATVTGLRGLPMADRSGHRIHRRLRLRPVHLPGPVREGRDGWVVRGRRSRSVLPEWLSMNFVMAGMFPTMVLLMMGRDMRAMEPTQLVFWGAMSMGSRRRPCRRLSDQRLDGREGSQARHGDERRAQAKGGHSDGGGANSPVGRVATDREAA